MRAPASPAPPAHSPRVSPQVAGALWVCVAETIMHSTGIPVLSAARAFAASISSRGIMHESTTQSAIRVAPRPITTARACNRSVMRVPAFSRNPPFSLTGSTVGVTSTFAASATNPAVASAALPKLEKHWANNECKTNTNSSLRTETAFSCSSPLGSRRVGWALRG